MSFYNETLAAQTDEYIAENKEQIISDLMKLVRIPSVQSEPLPDAPFGKACADMLYETATLFEKNGFSSTVKAENGYALSFFENNSEKTIGLFSHGDVVPADGEWIMCPPFEPVIHGEHMFGRGCNDDKSGIIETLYAAKIIRDLKLPLKSNLLMYTGANEESGMEDIIAYVKNEKMPDVSIVPDGGYPCYSGEKSTLRFELVNKKPFRTLKKLSGGKAFNVILDEVQASVPYSEKLYNQLNEKCKDNERFTLSADNGEINITAKGISAHSASPQGSLNACFLMAQMLSDCSEICENDRIILAESERLLSDYYGKSFDIEYEDESFGKLTCGNGIVRIDKNGCLTLMFDIRVGCFASLTQLCEKIRTVTSFDWNMNIIRCSQGYIIDDNSVFRKVIEKAYAEVSGLKGAECKTCSGGTYSRELKNAFSIGTVAYYKEKSKPDLPDGHGGYHQRDERLCIDGLMEAIKILVCIIMEIDSVL